jgi:uncharacterized Zn-finger protein
MAEAQMSSNADKVHTHYEVTRDDLPLQCPMPNQSLWNAHPRVFLPIEQSGQAKCPYCGAEYILKDK